jgi:SAM-dependent methyltransferase
MITNKPKQFWNKVSKAKNWREYILPKRSDEEFETEGIEHARLLDKYYKYSDTILDYGCGTGRILKHMDSKRKIGVDISEDYIELAKEDTSSEYYVTGKFRGKVDFIYSIAVLQHNAKPERLKIIKRILKLLNDGGRVFLHFPNVDSPNYRETDFVHVFTREEVEEYGKMFSGYKIEERNFYKFNKEFDKNAFILTAVK